MGPLAILGNDLWLFIGPGIACFLFWVLAGVLLAISGSARARAPLLR